MNKNYEKLKKKAAAKVLKSLYTNEHWFDTTSSKKKSTKNYLFIPIFDIAQASRSYNLETVKDACYLLHQNNHVNIWGDDYDSRAMLVQLSEEGIRAHKQSFYGNDLESFFRKGLTYVAATVMLMALIIGINKYNSNFKVVKNVLYRSTSKN